MAQNQHEAIAAMGIDTPLAVLSSQSQHYLLFQAAAQVTNPPIDARKELMTSTNVYLVKSLKIIKLPSMK